MFSLISEINANAYCTEVKVGARFKTQKEGRIKHVMFSWSHGGSLAGTLRVAILKHTFDGNGSLEDGLLSYHFCLADAGAAVDDIKYSESLIKEINNKSTTETVMSLLSWEP